MITDSVSFVCHAFVARSFFLLTQCAISTSPSAALHTYSCVNALFKSKSFVQVVSRVLAAGPQPRLLAAMKRSGAEAGMTDPSDRAQLKRTIGLRRVHLRFLGFWPGNRGTLGISAHHCHEVAFDVMTRRTKLARYGHVDLIEIPKEKLEEIREANRLECEAEPLLPRYSPDMIYVMGSKTHFVHAHKLAQVPRAR